MLEYRIVCTRQEPKDASHAVGHIVEVGIGNNSKTYDKIFTLNEVLDKMNSRDSFYTKSASGDIAYIISVKCEKCGRLIIRSSPDKELDNNLDNLPRCNKN